MKTTHLITVSFVSSALLSVLGFALASCNLPLASVINVIVGTFVSSGLFGILLWDTGRTIKASETVARFEQRRCRNPHCPHQTSLHHRTALAGC